MNQPSGAVLRRLRLQSGSTLAEVARALGLSVPYLSDLERGQRNLHAIQPATFSVLVKALDLDEDGDDARELRDAVLSSLANSQPWVAVLLEELNGAGFPAEGDTSEGRRAMEMDCIETARRLGVNVDVVGYDTPRRDDAQD